MSNDIFNVWNASLGNLIHPEYIDESINTPYDYFTRYRSIISSEVPHWTVGTACDQEDSSCSIHIHADNESDSQLYFNTGDYSQALDLDLDPLCALGFIYTNGPFDCQFKYMTIANAHHISECAEIQISGLINYLHAIGNLSPDFYIAKHYPHMPL
jgi:hypothetical protein